MKKKIILTIFLVYISILVINNVHALENGFTNPLVMYRIPDNGEEGILSARVIVTNGTGHIFVDTSPYTKVDLLTRGISILVVIATRIAPILVVIVAFIALLQRANKHKIEFIKEKFYEPTKKPVDSDWGIRIFYPNRPIEKCIILYNNTPLPWWDNDKPYYEKRIEPNSSGIVRVPKVIQKDGAKVRFKNGKKTLLKVKFEHLTNAKPYEPITD
ncbi:MAG: hypothetical protein O8C66_05150 [Candidatus Methanoperedens sp.]|nr:hypothetical protein [Candidatus Methanoperedens sp.]MCZ7369877.1 hypothetical protein [Candidatus Methanoperedens sp.]